MNPEINTIGRYQVRKELGRGGMATVYDAYDPRFERSVAIKVLPREFLHDPQFRARFEREAKMVALLEHPAIVPVYDFGEHEGQPYIVMQLMNGGSLADRLEKGPITPSESISIINRLAQALDVAHSKGIVHRDLKPGNILFDQYGNAFLSDFGIARLKESSGGTLTGSQIIGTPAYMSPEQIQGEKTIDGRSDIYALGIILFLMLSNQMPFQADTPAKVMIAHIIEPAPSILVFREDLPPGIDDVIDKALAKDADDRYQTGAAMAEEFAEVVRASMRETRPHAADAPINPSVRSATPTRLSTPKAGPLSSKTAVSKAATLPPITAPPPPVVTPAKSSRGLTFALGGLLLLALLFGGGFIVVSSLFKAQPTPTALAQTTLLPTETLVPTEEPPTPTLEPSPTEEGAVILPTDIPAPTDTPAPTEAPTESPTEIPVANPLIIGGADKIAYVRDGEIRVVNFDGTDEITLTSGGGGKSNLSWTADGRELFFLNDKCLRALDLEGNATFTGCFLNSSNFEGYAISSLGDQIALAIDNELFIVPFDRTKFSGVSTRKSLIDMATCSFYAPVNSHNNHKYKDIRWSSDDQTIATKISGVGTGATAGLNIDQILLLDISTCDDFSKSLDVFPAERFNIDQYDKKPFLTSWDWNQALNLFAMTSFTSRDNFGEIYIYNGERKTGQKFNPFGVVCCYRDVRWSPDGTHLLFAYQELAPNAPTQLYIVPFGTGAEPILLPLPPVTALRELPEPALRPAVSP